MSTTVTINPNTFNGKFQEMLSWGVQYSASMTQHMTVVQVNSAIKMPKANIVPVINAYARNFSAAGSFDMTERELIVRKFRCDLELPNDLMDDTWKAIYRSVNEGYPTTSLDSKFLSGMMSSLMEKYAFMRDEMILNSDTANNALPDGQKQYDGLIKLLTNDTNVGSAGNGAIDATNIEDIMQDIVIKISTTKLRKLSTVCILVPSTVMALLRLNKNIMGVNMPYANENRNVLFYTSSRYEIHEVVAMPDDKMIISNPTNLILGTNDVNRDFKASNQMNGDGAALNNYTRFSSIFSEGVIHKDSELALLYGKA